MLKVAEENGLVIKWEKCDFLSKSTKFLGHVVENGSIKPSIEKISAVRNFPKPTNVKQVQSFLGLTGFFRKFVPNYAVYAKPLSDLTKKESEFVFGSDQIIAFESLKDLLCKEPVLKLFNPTLETELHTDASMVGYGGVLLQKHEGNLHPVFYMSFKATPAEKNYTSYEHEVLAIVKCIKKLRVYLLGMNFKIYTDCKAFQATMNKKDLCPRVARWAIMLQEYSCEVLHRSGSSMRHVDALSRYPTVLRIEDGIVERIKRSQGKDEFCQLIIDILSATGTYKDYEMRNDLLYKFVEGTHLLVVPKSMQKEILRGIHGIGHIGARRMEAICKQDYFIHKIGNCIDAVIANCVPCILAARKEGKAEGFLHPIEKSDVPLHTYHVDHLGPLPSTNKFYNYLFVVVDAFSKFVWIYPVKTTKSEEVVKKMQQQNEVYGSPARIISDRGAAFTANVFKEFCQQHGIHHILTTTGVPRGNGQVERINRIIVEVLTRMSVKDPKKWYKHIAHVQGVINSTISRSTKRSPFQLMFGTMMRREDDIQLRELLEEAMLDDFENNRDAMRKAAKAEIQKVQEENKKTFNRKRKASRRYQLHDLVAIKRTQFGAGLKLFIKFMGPYEVTNIRGNDRYDVRKVGQHDGPNITSTSADYMKPWVDDGDDDEQNESDGAQVD